LSPNTAKDAARREKPKFLRKSIQQRREVGAYIRTIRPDKLKRPLAHIRRNIHRGRRRGERIAEETLAANLQEIVLGGGCTMVKVRAQMSPTMEAEDPMPRLEEEDGQNHHFFSE
jgi:hypothetical protein